MFLTYLSDTEVRNLTRIKEFQAFNSPYYENIKLFFDGTKIIFRDGTRFLLADYDEGKSLLDGKQVGDYLLHGECKVTRRAALAVEAYRAVWYNNIVLNMNKYNIVFYEELNLPMEYDSISKVKYCSNSAMLCIDTGDQFISLDKIALDVIASMVNFHTESHTPTEDELRFIESNLHINSDNIKMYKLNGYLHINDIMISNPDNLLKLF